MKTNKKNNIEIKTFDFSENNNKINPIIKKFNKNNYYYKQNENKNNNQIINYLKIQALLKSTNKKTHKIYSNNLEQKIK